MKQLLNLFFLFWGFTVSAQTLSIKVVDAETNDPLPRSTIVFGDSTRKFTDDQGVFRLFWVFPATVKISYIGYKTQKLSFKKFKQDTILVKLVREKQLLDEVQVLPVLPKFIFFGSPDLQVIDYEFIDHFLVVGVYHNLQRKCSVLVLDSNHKIVDEQPLPADFERFYVSGINRYYAVSGSVIQELQLRRQILTLKYINSDFFYEKVVYYKGFYKDYLYIMDTHVSKQVHFYYVEHITKPENTIRPLAILGNQHIYDSYKKDVELTKLYRQAEMVKLYELIGPSAFDGYYQTETKGEFGRQTYFNTIYKDVYSQLFLVDSVVYLFDFIEGNLNLFSCDGIPLTSSPIVFHQKAGWKPFVQQSGNGYYTAYETDGYLQIATLRFNFTDVGMKQQLYHPKPYQWKVHDGYVYYLNATAGYPQNVFLFREVLK